MSKHTQRNDKCVAYIVLSHAPVLNDLVKERFGSTEKNNMKIYMKYCCSFEVVRKGNDEPEVIRAANWAYMDNFTFSP